MKSYFSVFLIFILIISANAQMKNDQVKDTVTKMYVGTYTKKEGHVDGKANGIYLLHQNPENGNLKFIGTAAEQTNPSFVKTGKMSKYLYAVSELGPADAESGFVYSYEIQPDGNLKSMGKATTGGFAPCHIAIDRSGKYVFVSNYVGGIVMVYNVQEDGSLAITQELKLNNADKAHAHSVTISGDNRYAYIADLGNDKIWIYNFDAITGKLTEHPQCYVDLPEGSGPRHFTFSKNGSFAYSINELNSSVSVFSVDRNGGLELIQNISSLPESYKQKNAAADIHLHPSGDYLYASNRGHNSIAVFKVNSETGKLTALEFVPIAGETPRNFAISPYGKYLYAASQDTGNITTYKIIQETGKLKPQAPVFEVKTPVCLEFLK